MESKNNDTRPHFVSSDATAFSHEYVSWLKNIKQLYRQSQAKAALKVNEELLRFYWALGRDMVALKIEEQWGKGVMKQLSLDLRAAFPEQKGFSHTNLKYIKRWYSFYHSAVEIGGYAPNRAIQVLLNIVFQHSPAPIAFNHLVYVE